MRVVHNALIGLDVSEMREMWHHHVFGSRLPFTSRQGLWKFQRETRRDVHRVYRVRRFALRLQNISFDAFRRLEVRSRQPSLSTAKEPLSLKAFY